MRFIILRMLSSASLSAFSASVQARARGAAPLVAPMPAREQKVRGQAEERTGNVAPGATAGSGGLQLAPVPARPPLDRGLPRGSLLDLSV